MDTEDLDPLSRIVREHTELLIAAGSEPGAPRYVVESEEAAEPEKTPNPPKRKRKSKNDAE
jgi:hypothetical protein